MNGNRTTRKVMASTRARDFGPPADGPDDYGSPSGVRHFPLAALLVGYNAMNRAASCRTECPLWVHVVQLVRITGQPKCNKESPNDCAAHDA
jgi:hypothetical protein